MKILVAGGAGFIGSHLVDRLVKTRAEVTVIDNLSSGKKENINPKAHFIERDIRFYAFTKRYDVIFHLAAQVDVRKSLKDYKEDMNINLLGGIRLLDRYKCNRFIFTSSGGAIYGDQPTPHYEGMPELPLSPYGIHKLAFEKYLHMHHINNGQSYLALRLANVYGPRQDGSKESGVISIFKHNQRNNKESYIFGSGNQIRDYVHVNDVVAALIKGMHSDYSGVLNIGTGLGTSVKTLSKMIPNKYIKKNRIIGEVEESVLANDLALARIGWIPTISLEKGLCSLK